MQNKKSNPKILLSVIIPAKNNLQYLREAISSVLNQNFPCQIIVIDDGSSPPLRLTLEKKFPQVLVISNKKSKGAAYARNQGLNLAKGDFIAFLDSDDYWKPNFVRTMINTCQESEGVALCFSSKIFSKGFGFKRRIVFEFLNGFRDLVLIAMFVFKQRTLLHGGFYLAQVSHMLFDRSAIEGIKFNEFYKFGEDWQFISKVQQRVKIKIVPQKLLFFRYHHESLSFKNKEKWLFYRKLFEELPPTAKKGFLTRFFSLYIKFFSRLN